MREATVIFPHQLFRYHPGVSKNRPAILVEDPHLFSGPQRKKMKFHKKKLMLYRASMQAYKDELVSKRHHVLYVDYNPDAGMSPLVEKMKKHGISRMALTDVVDSGLEKNITKEMDAHQIEIDWLASPSFLTPKDWYEDFFEGSKHYSQSKFYIAQRKRLNILIDNKGHPLGGKWSFDPENRKKIPENAPIPELIPSPGNKYTEEARVYVEKNFPDHPGTAEAFIYPVTHKDTLDWLQNFLKSRMEYFGDYEDAMVREQPFLFHSVLTPMLNIGLITPKEVIDQTLSHADAYPVPLNSLEGFIRQVVGWREFMRVIYALEEKRERTTNFWNHTKKIPLSFYKGTTSILPVDTVILRLHEQAYAHHIERLMVLGNIMLLCEFHPDSIYRWFMEMFIDSYDWVMVPNVYGMSQYADGGLITTKPYISSSAYIRKMSDFPPGPWCEIWDALYWRFIHKHRDFFEGNPRMKVMTFQLEKMDKGKLKDHLRVAEGFLGNL
jgi:deoxyribodipyrimidine photolyase-related protein